MLTTGTVKLNNPLDRPLTTPMDLTHLSAPDTPLAIIGLGYVGLPLAVEFGQHRPVIGFDIKPERIAELQAGHDSTRETTPAELAAAVHLTVTRDPEDLRPCRIFIVTVPTPVDAYKRPDLTPLLKASATVGAVLKPGDLVIYESTVYPGCTEEDCAPVLEKASGLKYLSSPSPQPSPARGEGARSDPAATHWTLRRHHPRRRPSGIHRHGTGRHPCPGQDQVRPLRRQVRPAGGSGGWPFIMDSRWTTMPATPARANMNSTHSYETDYLRWLDDQAACLRVGAFDQLDREHLYEELESMSRSERRQLRNRLIVLVLHLLKLGYQPDRRSRSWSITVVTQRVDIKLLLRDSPSLRPTLSATLDEIYDAARREAAQETGLALGHFPPRCPFTLEQVLDDDYWPTTAIGDH